MRQFKHLVPALALTAAFFIIDINTPLGLSDWLLYVFPLLILTWNTDDKTVIASTSVFSILLLIGFFLSPPGNNPVIFSLMNRSVGISVLWTIAFIMIQRKDLLEKERRARASAERDRNILDAMMENIPDGIIIADAPDAAIRRVSRYGYELAGVNEEQLVGLTWKDHPQAWNIHEADGSGLVKPGELPVARAISHGEFTRDKEFVFLRPDGEKVPILVNAGPIVDRNGRITGAISAFRDIREYKRTQRALRENEERLELLFKNSYDGIIFATEDGSKVIAANNSACSMLGYSCKEMVTKKREDLFDYGDLRFRKFMEVRKATGRAAGEVTLVRKDGTKFEGDITSVAFSSDGNNYVGIIIRDISWRKDLERQRDDFLSMVSHDLKSPLTAIMGYSELILSRRAGNMNPDSLEMLNTVYRNGRKLMDMVEGFLITARIHSGRIAAQLNPGDINALLSQVVKDLVPAAHKKKQELLLDAGDIGTFLFDRRLLDRAVSNLVTNALNYTQTGGRITMKSETVREGEADWAVISVADTGPGISREDAARIFDRYYRPEKSSGKKGFGLGLSIVKAVAELHGGRAEVESEEGEGSVFRIILPMKKNA